MKTQHYDVIELRRYRLKAGTRAQFARCFESWFPDAFQQLGAITFGHFVERAQADRFTCLRGYRDMAARLTINEAFYDGPVWAEHKARLNAMLVDSDDVLLLRPLHAGSAPPALPAVDPLAEAHGAQGIAVAHVVKLAPQARARASAAAEACFACYHGRGVTELGVLATLDVPNDLARQPIRSDGHYLVWLGMLRDEAALAGLRAQCDAASCALFAAGHLDGALTPAAAAELLVLDPGARSRLRWIDAHALSRAAPLELAA
jgi:hypothetical protein